jgi:hypothetical protein
MDGEFFCGGVPPLMKSPEARSESWWLLSSWFAILSKPIPRTA